MQIRSDNQQLREMLAPINDFDTRLSLRAEREFLRLLQGDCGSPVGVLGTIEKRALKLRAQVFEPARLEPRAGAVEGSVEDGVERLAAELMEQINGG